MVSFSKLATVLLVPCAFACTPAFSDRSSEVSGPRVLAVRSSPAQSLPKKDVSYQALVVDEQGAIAQARVGWSYCNQPKPTNELNDVASACFGEGNIITAFGTGMAPTGTMPVDACAQFGPDVPHPTTAGSGGSSSSDSSSSLTQTKGRPTDPDSTGGFYQPVILQVAADHTQFSVLAETRIDCGLGGGTIAQVQDYAKRNRSNENPQLSAVTIASLDNAPLTLADAAQPQQVAASQTITLRASWPACPALPSCGDGICSPGEAVQDCPEDCTDPVKGCGGAEPFAYLDPESHELLDRHESMRVSWFANRGSFDSDHTGREEAEFTQSSSDNTWTAPSQAGPVFMWVVLRDDRGGVDWQSFKVDVH